MRRSGELTLEQDELFEQHAEILKGLIAQLDRKKYMPGAYMLALAKMLGAVAAMSTNGEKTLEAAVLIAKGTKQSIGELLPALRAAGKNPPPGYFDPGNHTIN